MSTLRVDNIKSRTGSVVTVPETNTLAVTGIVSVTSSGSITNAGNLTNTGNLTVGGNAEITGVTTISGSLVNNGTFTQSGTFSISDLSVSGNATVGGNLTVNGTTTTLDTVNLVVEDKNIGIGTTTTPSNTTADGGGLTIFGGSDGDKTLTWEKESTYFTFNNGIDIPGAVETVGTATTSETGVSGEVCLELDARTGTLFEHNIDSNGSVGIVSLTNFPSGSAKAKSGTTFTVIFTQSASITAGAGNTTTDNGLNRNVTLKPYGQVAIAGTEAKVGSGSSVTLSTTNSDIDFVTFFVRSGTASTVAYATANGSFRFG